MRHRRTSHTDDGLGLLLDAICNTFGAVLLIAILVAIILNTSVKNAVPTDEEIERARQLQSLEISLLTLQAEKESLLEIVNLPKPTSPVEMKDVETARLEAQLSAIRKRLNDKNKIVNQKLRERASGNKQHREFIIKHETLSKEAKALQEELEVAQNACTRPASFPLLSSATKNSRQIVLLVRYDRLYQPHRITRQGPVVNLDDMFVSTLPNGDTEARAKPNAGIDLQSPNAQNKIEQILKPYNPRLYSFAVLFGPESHESYEAIASVLKKNNFYFFPWPIDQFGVWDRGGKAQSRQ